MALLCLSPLSAMFLTTFVLGGENPDVWGIPHKGLQMAVRADKPSYRVDETVVIDVAIRNTTKEPIWLGMSIEDQASFEVIVNLKEIMAGGLGRMPLTRYGVFRYTPLAAGKNVPIRLEAGEVRNYRFPLNRMYDMTFGGHYTVTVNRSVPGRFRYDPDGRPAAGEAARPIELKSNDLSLTLIDKHRLL